MVFLKGYTGKTKGNIWIISWHPGVIYLIASSAGGAASTNNFLGSALIIFSTLSWGVGAVYSRVANVPKSPVLSSGLELIFGGMLVLITGIIIGEPSHFHLSQVTLKSFLGLLYLIIFGSVIAFSAYVWLLSHTSVTRISTHTYVNPVIAVFLGWLFANEQITASLLVSTCMIIISVYLVLNDQYRDRKNKLNVRIRD